MLCVSTYRNITNNGKYPPYACGLILYKTKDYQRYQTVISIDEAVFK